MRIATYNLWNSAFNWPQRLAAIAEELAALDADIVAMQEAPAQASEAQTVADYLREQTGYRHVLHLIYPETPRGEDRPEGLAFLSRLPLTDVRISWDSGHDPENSWGARVVVDWQGVSLGITNVHLDWKHAANRERQIVRIVRDLIDARPADVDLLCGDFNDDGDAPSLSFLNCRTTLHGHRNRAPWRDLALAWHAERGEAPPVTLDFEHNPRWKPKKIAAPSKRFDRIYLRTRESQSAPCTVRVGIFGREPANRAGIVPSDHYGAYVDLAHPRPLATLPRP